MRQIINEISKGKNIDDNLKKYADGFSKINNKFAYIRLALNYSFRPDYIHLIPNLHIQKTLI